MACRATCQVTGAPGRARLNVKASTGASTSAVPILTLKPMPIAAIAAQNVVSRPVSAARIPSHTPASSTRMRQLSVLLERSTATLIGLSASDSAAMAAGRPAPIFPHQNVNEEDRGQSRHHLGEQDRKRAKAEQLGAGDLQPDRHGRLVDGNKACGVERVEDEIVPATQHAEHACGVVLPAKIVLRKLPGSRQHSHRRNERERQGRFQQQGCL